MYDMFLLTRMYHLAFWSPTMATHVIVLRKFWPLQQRPFTIGFELSDFSSRYQNVRALLLYMQIRKVSVGKRVSLEVLITYDGDPADLRYEWRSLSENFDLSNNDLLLSDRHSPFLVLARNALLPGVEYLFEATVSAVRATEDDSRILLGDRERKSMHEIPMGAGNSAQFVQPSKSGKSPVVKTASDVSLLQGLCVYL